MIKERNENNPYALIAWIGIITAIIFINTLIALFIIHLNVNNVEKMDFVTNINDRITEVKDGQSKINERIVLLETRLSKAEKALANIKTQDSEKISKEINDIINKRMSEIEKELRDFMKEILDCMMKEPNSVAKIEYKYINTETITRIREYANNIIDFPSYVYDNKPLTDEDLLGKWNFYSSYFYNVNLKSNKTFTFDGPKKEDWRAIGWNYDGQNITLNWKHAKNPNEYFVDKMRVGKGIYGFPVESVFQFYDNNGKITRTVGNGPGGKVKPALAKVN